MKTRTTCAICAVMVALAAGSALAQDQTYLAVRGGIYLPNGENGDNYQGFDYFDTGYNLDIAAGYRPVPYAAIELGTGFYTASGEVSTQDFTIDRTAYGVPITLTVKGILEVERLMLSAGAGVGYYQGFIDNKITMKASPNDSVDETNHGGALGYQVAADLDFKLNDNWYLGANFKWFTARPDIEMKNPNVADIASSPIKTEDEWEIGGTTINLGIKYLF